jgi:hypothetical protein
LRNAFFGLLRIFAYLYHLILSLFLLGLGIVVWSGGENNLKLGMLPWEGAALTKAIVILGAVGLLCVLSAILGKFRWLLVLWSLFVLVMMFRGFFLSSYSFPGEGQFKFAVWLTAGALIAFLASLTLFGRGKRSS